jgi:hypothetical protein
MTHWIDVIQWIMKSPAPSQVQSTAQNMPSPGWSANYSAIYYCTEPASLEGGGIIFAVRRR